MEWPELKQKAKEECYDLMVTCGMLMLGCLFASLGVAIPILVFQFITNQICN